MTQHIETAVLRDIAAIQPLPSLTTPAGLQANTEVSRRRAVMLVLTASTYAGYLAVAGWVLAAGGWSMIDTAVIALLAIAKPWSVLGFWNAIMGLWLLHGRSAGLRSGLSKVAPYLEAGDHVKPVSIDTAVLMTLRNEDPARAVLRLKTVKDSLDATDDGARYSYFVLSDTGDAGIAAAEHIAVESWRRETAGGDRIVYRRRTSNEGYKGGNIRDFCARWGADFELMLPLDADSLMSGREIVRMTRIMAAYPRLGILQSLVVGTPSSSAFARIFQFGMRHGMRAYTMGQAWWTADCGPFWGHNALVRIRPFKESCALPIIPGRPPFGGHVLSHDQVEAALMRGAGYEVRVMPVEGGSWEDNPPTIIDFLQRDVRWCQGNMQYLRLLGLKGVHPVSRFQLLWAILMFVGIPAWTLLIAVSPFAVMDAQAAPDFPVTTAAFLYSALLLMHVSPKLAGLIDAMLTPGEVRRFGGVTRFGLSAVIEIIFSFLQGAASTIHTTIFMGGLLFGRSVRWGGQSREASSIRWRAAMAWLWPQLLFGVAVTSALFALSPAVFLWSLPLTAGYLLAVPFAVATGAPVVGRALRRVGLCGIPEDFDTPAEIRAVQNAPAIQPALSFPPLHE